MVADRPGRDKSMILVTAPLIRKRRLRGLPDLVDPLWRAADYTEEEARNPDCDADCRKQWDITRTGEKFSTCTFNCAPAKTRRA